MAVSVRRPKGRCSAVGQSGRRYLFTGGGTGGHVTPNLALIGEIRRRDNRASFLYLGSPRGYERKVAEHGVPLIKIPCAQAVSPRRPLRFLAMIAIILAGLLKAAWIILRFRPHVVIATGGFVSVPTALAAALLRRRIFLHEQNARLGAANRTLAQFATRIATTFERTVASCPSGKGMHLGYPVRSKIGSGSREAARARYGIPAERRTVFIVGGSMGARSINRGAVEALKTLIKNDNVAVIHSTGLCATPEYDAYDDTCARLRKLGLSPDIPGRYVCRRFIEDIQDVYALADLVVARSGAGTMMELGAIGKPSLLIPKSDSPGGHQLENALTFAEAGAAEIFYEEPCDEDEGTISRVYGDQLGRRLTELLDDEELRLGMGRQAHRMVAPDALAKNVDEIEALASGAATLRTRRVPVRTAALVDSRGTTHELLFSSNLVSGSALADVRLAGASNKARAVIHEHRTEAGTAFGIVPRAGWIDLNGQRLTKRTTLHAGDRVRIGGERFTVHMFDREIDREERALAVPRKLLVTAAGTLLSRMFGLARDVMSAAVFSLGRTLDLMSVGLRVSNFFRAVFAETAVDSAFLPTFVQLFRSGRRDEANRLFSTVIKLTVAASAFTTLVAVFTLPFWIGLVAPGFAAKGLIGDAISLTRVMFPYLILISIAAVIAAVLKAFNHYALPANASIMFNLGVMAGVAGYGTFGIEALGWGVLLGGIGQILVQLPPLFGDEIRRGHGFRMMPGLDFKTPGLKRVGRVTPNILADTTISKAGDIVDVTIASMLAEGLIGALSLGRTLFLLPFGLVAQTVNTVVLKELSEAMATRDREFNRRLMVNGINWTVFLLLPISAALVILAEPIVRATLQYGRFTKEDARLVAFALQAYAVGLTGWGLVALSGRFFAARGEMGLGTITNLLALVVNVSLALALVKTPLGFAGIALASSIAFSIAAVVRLMLLNRNLAEEEAAIRWTDLWPTIFRTTLSTSAAAIAAAMSLAAVRDFEVLSGPLGLIVTRGFHLGVPLFFGTCAFAGAAFLLESEQMDEILARLQRNRGPADPGRAREGRPVVPQWLAPEALLAWVERNPAQASHRNLNKRVAQLLDRPRWQDRNIGAKLAGILQMRPLRARLCALVTDRVRAPLHRRMLGADFEEPGFVRRNAVASLGQLGDPDGKTEAALLIGLRDPYYEVRVAAARAFGLVAPMLSTEAREKAQAALLEIAQGRCFEAAAAAVKAIGLLARDDSVILTLKRLHYHHNWQVRAAVVCAYEDLHSRGIVMDVERLRSLIDDVLVTCDTFLPRFRLKEDLLRARRRFEQFPTASAGGPA